MPAVIGSLQIITVGGGVVQFGDSLNISPKSNTKSNSGSGSTNTAGFVVNNNGLSSTNTLDKDLIDQPSVANE